MNRLLLLLAVCGFFPTLLGCAFGGGDNPLQNAGQLAQNLPQAANAPDVGNLGERAQGEGLGNLGELAQGANLGNLGELARGANLGNLGELARGANLGELAQGANLGELAKGANLGELARGANLGELAQGANLGELAQGADLGNLGQLIGGGAGAEDMPNLEGKDEISGSAKTMPRPGDPHDATVILVHGLGGGTWNFTLLKQFMQKRGFSKVEAVSLPGNALSMDIARFAGTLEEKVEKVAASGEKTVYLVGHSLGGSVILDYLRTRKSKNVAIPVAVAMASPLKLTLLQRLNAGTMPDDVEFHCMVMEGDKIVRGETSVIDGAHVHRMNPGGISPHMAPVTDAEVMGKLCDILEG